KNSRQTRIGKFFRNCGCGVRQAEVCRRPALVVSCRNVRQTEVVARFRAASMLSFQVVDKKIGGGKNTIFSAPYFSAGAFQRPRRPSKFRPSIFSLRSSVLRRRSI